MHRLTTLFFTLSSSLLLGGESFSFSEPHILKVGWYTQALYAGDIDRDGKSDFAIIDNDKARITFYYGGKASKEEQKSLQQDRWEPILENSSFTKTWFTTAVSAYDLTFADLNGNGLNDMIYVSERNQIIVVPQTAKREWGEPQEYDTEDVDNNWSILEVGEFDQKKGLDIALLTQKSIGIFSNHKGLLQAPQYYPAQKNSYGLQAKDVNQDSKTDLIYQSSHDSLTAYLTLQTKEGFPSQQLLNIAPPHSFVHFDSKKQKLINLSSRTNTLDTYSIQLAQNELKPEKLGITSFPLPFSEKKVSPYLSADLNQNGRKDLVVASAKTASLHYYARQKNGSFSTAKSSACFAGISQILETQLRGKPEILIFSPQEEVLGLTQLEKDGTFSFPKEIVIPGTIKAFDLCQKQSAIAIYTEQEKKLVTLLLTSWKDGAWVHDKHLIKNAPEEITFMMSHDFDTDGKDEFLLIDSNGDGSVLRAHEKGYEVMNFKSEFSNQLLENIKPLMLTRQTLGVTSNQAGFTIIREGFARSIRLNKELELEVVHQMNHPQPDVAMTTLLKASYRKASQEDYLCLSQEKKQLDLISSEGKVLSSITLPLKKIAGMDLIYDKKTLEEILIVGSQRVLQIPVQRKLLLAKREHSYQTDIKDLSYQDYRVADFNQDEYLDLVAIDTGKSHLLEILVGSKEGFKSHLHFKIFEEDPHYRGRKGGDHEPSDFFTSDMNNDGKADLILHIHDRVLVYYQN